MPTIHRHGQTDGRTHGRTTYEFYDSNTALALRASRGKKDTECLERIQRALCGLTSGGDCHAEWGLLLSGLVDKKHPCKFVLYSNKTG